MNEKEFLAIYEVLNEKSLHRMTRIMSSVEDAEDIVSRSWMTLWRIRDRVDVGKGVTSLFWKILKLQCKDYVRDDVSRKRIFGDEFLALYPASDASAEEMFLAIESVKEFIPRPSQSVRRVQHGNYTMYKNHKCRCQPCTIANRLYHRDYIKRKSAA